MIRKQKMLPQKIKKEKERKEEGDLGKNMNCFSQHLVDDSFFKKKKKPQTFFEPVYLFFRTFLTPNHVKSRINSILIEK